MNYYTDISHIEHNKNTFVTLGTFDGIHLGHINILKTLIKKANELNCRNFVITFEPHPRTVISTDYNMQILTNLEEKKELFEKMNVENLLVINFTDEFSQIKSEDFIKKFVCDKIGTKHIVIGYDHKFGKNRRGDENKLRLLGDQLGFGVTTVEAVEIQGDPISSTKIRQALLNGDLQKANDYLGRYYSFTGSVVHGANRGKSTGFPTANIELFDRLKLIPADGVYVVRCILGEQSYFGLLNIGSRPTFEADSEIVVEVHLLDFNAKIYNRPIKVEIIHRIRDERKFESKEKLIHQIEEDKKFAVELIGKLINSG